MLPVSRLCPGLSAPTELRPPQPSASCSGCGSDAMSCRRASLLTNRTRVPAVTVNSFGLTPAAVIVNVNGFDGVGPGEVLPPQDTAIIERSSSRTRMAAGYHLRLAEMPSRGIWCSADLHVGPVRLT